MRISEKMYPHLRLLRQPFQPRKANKILLIDGLRLSKVSLRCSYRGSSSLRLLRLTRLMCRSKSPLWISSVSTSWSKVGTVQE